ncbi:hypothetical protein ACCS70_18765 [Rhizobium ruizarguesonis]
MNQEDQVAAIENFSQVMVQYDIAKLSSRLDILKSLKSQELGHLLRHHDQEPVTDEREIMTRAELDSLLHGLSVIEIGCLAGVLPEHPAVAEAVTALLRLPEVSNYFTQHYPLTLPAKLLERVWEGSRRSTDPDPYWFGRLLALDGTFSRSAMRYFLMFVDGFWFEEINFGHLSRSLQSHESCLRAIATPHRERTALQKGIAGTEQFLIFCDDLVSLREETAHDALRESLLELYRYWFRIRSTRLLDILLMARENFPPAPGDGMATSEQLRQLFGTY